MGAAAAIDTVVALMAVPGSMVVMASLGRSSAKVEGGAVAAWAVVAILGAVREVEATAVEVPWVLAREVEATAVEVPWVLTREEGLVTSVAPWAARGAPAAHSYSAVEDRVCTYHLR